MEAEIKNLMSERDKLKDQNTEISRNLQNEKLAAINNRNGHG
jgi:hypothetical protein